jgi:hypothetical protein
VEGEIQGFVVFPGGLGVDSVYSGGSNSAIRAHNCQNSIQLANQDNM